MKNMVDKSSSLESVGMIFYQLAGMSGAALYRFPWEIFASLGMAVLRPKGSGC